MKVKYLKTKRDLCLRLLPNGQWCETLKELGVIVGKTRVIVPVGFQTDFASVPRMFWRIIPPMGLYTKAAVIHDYLYYSRQIPKKDADTIFYHLMLFHGVGKIKSKLMYLAVKWFGGNAWLNHKE